MQPYPNQMLCGQGAAVPPTALGVSISPSSGSASSSGSAGFSATVTGATGAVSYSWSASSSSGSATVSGSGASVTVSWSGLASGGTVYVSCTATDSIGASGSGAGVLTRSSSPPMTDVVLSVSGSAYIAVGVSYGPQINASPVGGTSPYSYYFDVDVFDGIVQSGGSAVPYMNYIGGRSISGNIYCTVTDDNGTTIFRSIGLLTINY